MAGGQKISLSVIIVLILIISLSFSSISAQPAEPQAAKILLKSKQFVPAEKIPPHAQDKILETSGKKGKAHVLIQLDHLPSEQEKQQLASEGIVLLNYIPDRAWLASVLQLSAASQRADVAFIGNLNPEDKIDPDLLVRGIPDYARNPDGTANFSVMFFVDSSAGEIKNIVSNYATEFIQPVIGGIWTVKLPEEKLNEFAAEDIVHWVEAVPGPLQELNDGSRSATAVNTVQTSPYNLNGTGVVLAEWDSGYATHTDFNSRATQGDQGGSNKQHSTHVAGTMLGDGSNSANKGGTAAQWRGMATNATLIIFEWPNNQAELYNESNISSTLYEAVLSQNSWSYNVDTNGCEVLGKYNSWTASFDNVSYGDSATIDNGKQLIIVFAAGNERDNSSNCIGVSNGADNDGYGSIPGPGATAKNTIAVGAVNSDDETMTSYSSWGPTRDGRLKPEIVAPGDETGGDAGIKSTDSSDDGYVVLTGTSMAAPAVSGAIGLMMQAYRNAHNNASFKPATAKAILAHTAKDLNNTGPDFTTGYGLINATRAIGIILKDNSTNSTSVIIENNVTNGNNVSYNVLVSSASSDLKITLAWDDVPGDVTAAKELVNDLDLLVIAPNGSQMWPWTLSNATRILNASRNQTNNIDILEQVYINDTVPTGIWTVAVNASVAVGARQNFSLISSNSMFLDNLTWNTTVLELNATQGAVGYGTALALSFKTNDNANVSEISGNGTAILSANATALGNLAANGTPVINFSCAPSNNAVGIYEALYMVNSSNNTQGGVNLTVKCSVGATSSPLVYIMSPSANNTSTSDTAPTITFNFTDSDNSTGHSILYFNATTKAVNESAQNNTPTNLTTPELDEGIYDFWVNVSDNITNVSSSRYQIIIDAAIPANLTSVANNSQGPGWINWSWTFPTDTSGINHTEVYLNDTFKINVSAPANYYNTTSLTINSNYSLEVRAVDNAGNIGNWTNVTANTTLDTGSPSVSLTSPSSGTSTSTQAQTFTCSAVDDYSLSNISLWDNFSGNWTLRETKSATGASDSESFSATVGIGKYVWNCMANDTYANSAFASANYTLTIIAADDDTGDTGTGGSGGGGGGGGGGGAPLPQENLFIGTVGAGNLIIKNFDKSGSHYIEQIQFETKEQIKNGYVRVTKYEGRPGATTEPPGKSFAYLNIETINFASSAIENTKIRFSVDMSWLASNKFSENDVVLRHFKDGKWIDFPAKKTGWSGTQYTFKAEVSGFSYFSISAEKKQAEEKAPAENITPTGLETAEKANLGRENVSGAGGGEGAKLKTPANFVVASAVMLVLFFAAALLLYLREKQEKKLAKEKEWEYAK